MLAKRVNEIFIRIVFTGSNMAKSSPNIEPWIIGIIVGAVILVGGFLVLQFGDTFSSNYKFSQYGWIGVGVGFLIIGLSAYAKAKS